MTWGRTSEWAERAASGFLAPIFRASRWGANFGFSCIEGVRRPAAHWLLTARIWGARNPDAATGGKADGWIWQEGKG